jgi:hypothetical protein
MTGTCWFLQLIFLIFSMAQPPPGMPSVTVHNTAAELGPYVARWLLDQATAAISSRGRFDVAFSGTAPFFP